MTQRYQAQFAKQLVNQLIAILQRDQQAALAVINASRPPGRTLNPFAAFFKEAAPIQNWPAIVLVARTAQFDQASDADLRTQTHAFFCAMAISGTDPEWLADDAMDYLHAVDIVLTSVPLGDFYLPLPISHRTVPSGQTSGLSSAVSKIQDLRVTRHDMGALVARRGGTLARGPQIEFVIELEER
ncbi:MAG: hypothetical protein ABSB82_02550 [Terriglobia bacterium]|jgi:hypothetical protein